MAKEKDKKLKGGGERIGHSKAKMKAPVASPTEAIVSDPPAPPAASASNPESESNVAASLDKKKEKKKSEHLSGFIFMCNSSTKVECYRYRVFGLPYGAKEVVERIKPGAKLFLYDFELKLLYGVYEATSSGKLHLEPAAFRGRFPAQVNFKIYKECFPLPESILRSVIKENYTGSKFNQELGGKLVEDLISTFLPLHESLSQPGPHALAYASRLLSMHPLAGENPTRHTGRLLVMEDPYLSQIHHSLISSLAGNQPVSNIPWQHGYHHRPAAYGEHTNFYLDHQSLPGTSVTLGVQDSLYSRYPMGPPQYGTSVVQPQPHTLVPPSAHQSATQGQALYGDNRSAYNSYPVRSAQYTASAPQPQVPQAGMFHQSPSQGQSLYGDNVSAYNPYPVGSAQYIPSAPQPQVLPGISHRSPQGHGQSRYGENMSAYKPSVVGSAQYVPSASQPHALPAGIPQGSGAILSYYPP